MERAELAGWLHLTLAPGIGNTGARRLLAAFGLPQDVLQQPYEALVQVVGPAQARALADVPADLEALLEATWSWLHAGDSTNPRQTWKRIVTLGDSDYPASLLATSDPPLLLYWLGPADLLCGGPDAAAALARSFERSIAIVGSRNPTPQGLTNARQFARALGQSGLTIVSGMALGIDGAAHEGALEGAGDDSQRLATIAVVGTGLDRVYPKTHLDLARRIAARGLIVSEYPIGTPPQAPNFPRRNRIISALSQGTLVVEAALQSGSLITAREASEQGREVFAIPGSIHSTQSRGCHSLIKQGAKLVESAQDVLEELRWDSRAGAAAGATDALGEADSASAPLLQALGFDPVGLDALQARTGIDTARLQAQLMALELQGDVARLPGGLFQRTAQT